MSKRKEKSADHSTEWSQWSWNENLHRWVSSRYDADGRPEYCYREDPRTPRSFGQNDADAPGSQNQYVSLAPGRFNYADHASSAYNALSSPPYDPSSNALLYAPSSAANYYQPQVSSSSSRGAPLAPLNFGYNYDSSSGADNPQPADGNAAGYATPELESITTDMARLTFDPPLCTTGQGQPEPSSAQQRQQSARRPSPTTLDLRYSEVGPEARRNFWKVGRVFIVLWTEPGREPKPVHNEAINTSTHLSKTWLGGTAYSEIRRFVVIQEGEGYNICSPIHTYGGQATLKPNLASPKQHAIIYTSAKAPPEKSYQAADGTLVTENLTKDPIRVVSALKGAEGDLGELSRINYSKMYTVENYVKILNIGMVHKDSRQTLKNCSLLRSSQPTTSYNTKTYPKRDDSSRNKGQGSVKGKGKEREGKRR